MQSDEEGADRGAQPALANPQTREALSRYRRRAVRPVLVGFAALVVATAVIGAAPDGDPKGIAGAVALSELAAAVSCS